jgi:hypothetical protein
MVGNFTPTLSTPKIGGVPLEKLQKKSWSGANFLGVEWSCLSCFGNFLWSGAEFDGAECSQTAP